MDDKKAVKILMRLLDKHELNNEERKAVKAAIGILSWTTLAKSRMKENKKKLDKSMQW
jgi:hypothetical protein